MATTTKEEKPSVLEDLKAQAADIAAKIKALTDEHLATLHTKLQDAHKLVQSITAEIQSHTGKPEPTKRARKPSKAKKVAAPKTDNTARKRKAKKGAMGEAIAAMLASKGKAGAHVKDIAAKIGKPVPNVTSFFYSPGGKTKYKNLGKATYALKN